VVIRPSVSRRGVVSLAYDAGLSTLPSMSARSHASKSVGVDQIAPAAPIQPCASGAAIVGSASAYEV